MKRLMISIVSAFVLVLVTVACGSAPAKNDDAPDWLVREGLKGRICGIGSAPSYQPELAEDRGRLDLTRKVVSFRAILNDNELPASLKAEDKIVSGFDVLNKNRHKTESESEQDVKIEEFLTKNFSKIVAFGEWKKRTGTEEYRGRTYEMYDIYKLMCLLTEEEIQQRIDKVLGKDKEEIKEKSYETMSAMVFNEMDKLVNTKPQVSEPAETSKYIWPIKNKIYPSGEDFFAGDDTAGFISSRFGDNRNHAGIDLAFKDETPVYSAASGTVVFAGCDSRCGEVCDDKCDKGSGKYIVISHPDGFETRYAKLADFQVVQGDKVNQGDLIGHVGHSGAARSATGGTGSHLHFEIRNNSTPVDPMLYLPDLSKLEESSKSEEVEKKLDFQEHRFVAPEETDDKKASEE